jgi:hypothetical protein
VIDTERIFGYRALNFQKRSKPIARFWWELLCK